MTDLINESLTVYKTGVIDILQVHSHEMRLRFHVSE